MSCPVCGKAADPKYRPFCSRRCADVDLAHWLRGDYAIPVVDEIPEEAPNEAPDGDGATGGADDFPMSPGRGRGRPH
ncbi:DNA gyrase inhibitor YacG [Acidimangrovimonas sediminis]|uniref:DNA gyrase inhibitor YacG n=1 Tax=Acidimangrovimonas sediminis TaxID=2056283 RepID=UPI000C80E470|nr:DNA gyrase inhibitor YacG [Acidimangrovimonas sediminis]